MPLLVWGSNKHSQLGVGERQDAALPRAVPEFGNVDVVDVAAGSFHTVVVTEFGDVYAFGRNKEGQAGVTDAAECPTPVKVPLPETATNVYCGAAHSMAITASGRLYVWGLLPQAAMHEGDVSANPREALQQMLPGLQFGPVARSTLSYLIGLASPEDTAARLREMGYVVGRAPVHEPQLCRSLVGKRVVAAAAGFSHSMALTEDGVLFTMGLNDRGQLGQGTRFATAQFLPVAPSHFAGEKIVRMACGLQHSLAVTESGKVYAWGGGSLGQLGISLYVKDRLFPCEVPPLAGLPVADVAAGSNHSVALLRDGSLMSWGHSEYGQHVSTEGGESTHSLFRYHFLPRALAPHPEARAEVAGVRFTKVVAGSNFTMAEAEDGRVFSWGWNDHGVLGHGPWGVPPLPAAIQSLSALRVHRLSAGQDHVVCAVAPVGHPHGSLMASLLSPAIDLRGQARGDAADDTFAATVAADAASSGVTLDAPAAAAAAPAAATAPAASAQQAKPVLSKYAAAAAVVSAELERVALPGARAPVLAAHSRAAAKVSHWLARGRGARDASDAATDATAAPAPAPLSPAEVEAARVALLAAAAHRPEFSDSLLLCEGKAMWAHCALLHLRCPELLRWCRAHHQPLLAAAAEDTAAHATLPPHSRGVVVAADVTPLVRWRAAECLLRYAYTDQVRFPLHRLRELKALAEALRVPRFWRLAQLQLLTSNPLADEPGAMTAVATLAEYEAEMGAGVGCVEGADVVLRCVPDALAAEEAAEAARAADAADAAAPSSRGLVRVEEMLAHRFILCRYAYFRGMLLGGFREGQTLDANQRVTLTAPFAADTLRLLLRWVYAGTKSVVSPDTVLELCVAAKHFGVEDLAAVCEQFVCCNVEAGGAAELLGFAEEYECPKLRQVCLDLLPRPDAAAEAAADGLAEGGSGSGSAGVGGARA